MQKILLFVLSIFISATSFSQIIADHTVVDRYDDIPQQYIDEVKKMWLVYAGESHSAAIRTGLALLESINPKFQVNITEAGTPESYTDSHLRASCATWGDLTRSTGWIYSYGEEDWFTSSTAINRTKSGITYCNTHSLVIAAMGLGWCWDTEINTTDEFNLYLNATDEYITHCTNNSYSTKVFFTTGTVDGYTGLTGYSKHLGYELIRAHVSGGNNRILFDYADILCYDDNSEVPNTTSYDGHVYPIITTTNSLPEQTGHISNAGALRLAKAMWWMLARIAGWDGGEGSVPVSGITVTGAGGASTITQDKGTLALTATVTPANATNKTVTWSINNGTGQATINSSGVVTAVSNGTVTARATANDGSGVSDQMVITISGQVIPVSSISVTGAGGASTITQDKGTLALTATVTPANATNKTVTWSIANGTGQATINSSGVVTAVSNGSVVARATANDGSGIFGEITITINNQVISVTGISISGGNAISTPGGSLQLSATVTPSNATDKSVAWSITGGTGQATISQNGLVTAVSNGNVIIRATANGGTDIYATTTISVTNQTVLVESITVTASGGSATMTGLETSLQLNAAVSPANATNKNVNWSVVNGSGQATISSTGLLTPVAYGTVTAIASAVDGSGVSGDIAINIVRDFIGITGISVSGQNGEAIINEIGGTLQLTAEVTPADASDKTITWSINNGTGRATISLDGLVTAEAYGLVTAVATANDGSGISGSLQIEIDDSQDRTLLPYINGNLLKVPLKRRFTGKKIALYDIYGRILETGIADSDIHEFDISKYYPGIYLIVLTDDNVLEVHKVVIH